MTWYKKSQNMNDAQEFFKKEELNPDLAPFVNEDEGMTVLQHPFVYMVPYFPQMNSFINKQYEQKKKAIEQSEAQGDFFRAVMLYEKPYRIWYLNNIKNKIPANVYWEVLGSVYTGSENVWQNKRELTQMFGDKRPGRENIMDEDERGEFGKIADIITIYRGCSSVNQNGMSWTLSKEKARWFALRFKDKNPMIITGQAHKKDIIAYFSRRDEQEIVIQPNKVMNKTIENLAPKGIK